jgi:hypothetical protein
VWTKGHDKLGVGVTQESHNKLWYEFPSKHREGKMDRDKVVGLGRECISKSMSTISGGERKDNLTS